MKNDQTGLLTRIRAFSTLAKPTSFSWWLFSFYIFLDRHIMNKNATTSSAPWLNQFARNEYSQAGEDGIIEKALEVINENDRWCVEFGAWDGVYLSNTRNLIANRGYSAVLIEGDMERCNDLKKNFRDNKDIHPIHAFVGFENNNGLDSILEKTDIPLNFDVLSIDIDGNDYHVWAAVKHYNPKLVVIEYNPTIPNAVEFIQPADMSITQGNSLLALTNLAKQKGYELIAVTQCNAIFVDSRYFELFGIADNSIDAIRTDYSAVTYLFNGYDGTVFTSGCGRVCWHSIPYRHSRMQLVPLWLRTYPGNYGLTKKVFAKIYRYLIGANRT
ncbi:MAG: hypothetical protein AB1545_16025 [Thermodesulfobacteriota bacterium]